MDVGILNYGSGNIGSLLNMFRKLDIQACVLSSPDELLRAPRLVLPGVGAFDHAMHELDQRNLIAPLTEYVASGRSLLGICLGMQLLVDRSEEGLLRGLGYVKGRCMRLEPPKELGLRVPHMGWNHIAPSRKSSLFRGVEEESRFYFAHSYFVECDSVNVLAHTKYGINFASVIVQDNVIGAQFHPEKSHVFGMTLLDNWGRE